MNKAAKPSSRRGLLRRALRWESPLRPALRSSAYVVAAAAGVVVGSLWGDASLGLAVGAFGGVFIADLLALCLDRLGRLPTWARTPLPSPQAVPGMGIYEFPIPKDDYGEIYIGRADQAPLPIWFKQRRARAQRRRAERAGARSA